MPAAIAKKAAEAPTAIPAIAPDLRPLDSDCLEVAGFEGVLEEPDEEEELLVDAKYQSASPLAMNLEVERGTDCY